MRVGIILYVVVIISRFLYLVKQVVRRCLTAHALCLCLDQELVFIGNLILLRLLECQQLLTCRLALSLCNRCLIFLPCPGRKCFLQSFLRLRDQLPFEKGQLSVFILDQRILDTVKIF